MRRGSVVPGFLDPGHWSACFGMSWVEMVLWDLGTHRRFMHDRATHFRKPCGTGMIPEGRNEVTRSFLDATDSEWLWFIDTDMGFDPDTIDRLVESADRHERPVMGGLCFAHRRLPPGPLHAERYGIVPTLYRYAEVDDEIGFAPMSDYPREQVVQVSGTGAACLLIHRRVLDAVRAKHGPIWFNPITHPTGLRGGPRTYSEDLSFCVRVAEVGFDVHVDTSVKTCHEKGGVYLTEELFDAQQAAAARVAAETDPAGASPPESTSAA